MQTSPLSDLQVVHMDEQLKVAYLHQTYHYWAITGARAIGYYKNNQYDETMMISEVEATQDRINENVMAISHPSG